MEASFMDGDDCFECGSEVFDDDNPINFVSNQQPFQHWCEADSHLLVRLLSYVLMQYYTLFSFRGADLGYHTRCKQMLPSHNDKGDSRWVCNFTCEEECARKAGQWFGDSCGSSRNLMQRGIKPKNCKNKVSSPPSEYEEKTRARPGSRKVRWGMTMITRMQMS